MDDAHSTDTSLLARMVHCDSKALDTFYTRHARAVFSLALTMLGAHTRATELTQAGFLLVWNFSPPLRLMHPNASDQRCFLQEDHTEYSHLTVEQ